ncbi:MAG TPA: MFS transporter [Thermomicrobiales bacterium]|nr:MFS transporter [Thermomicrobiales bacterium]
MTALPAAFRHRDFRLFWGGGLLSTFGSQFTTVALLWQVYLLTNSALAVGLLGLARAGPQILVALFGGLLADAVDRRRLLMATQVVQCAVSAGLAALTATGAVTPGTLYVASALFALASALEGPSRAALVPNLVPLADLRSAIAVTSTQRSAAAVLGPALAGVLLAFAGPAWCYAIDALSWFAMLAALAALRGLPRVGGGRRAVSLAALREGFGFVLAQPVILSFMALDFGATFFGSSRALLPVYARDILHVGATGLGLLYAAASVGALLAAGVVGVLPGRERAGRWVLLGVVLYGVAMVAFALSRHFWLSLLMLGLTGAGDTISSVLRGMANQLLAPDAVRGRVAAVNSMFVIGGPQLGQFESGVVAGLWGAEVSALTGGLGALLVVLAIALVPGVRHFRLSDERE